MVVTLRHQELRQFPPSEIKKRRRPPICAFNMRILRLNVKLDSYLDSWHIFFPFHFAAQPTVEVTFPINHLVCPTYVKFLRSVFYFYFFKISITATSRRPAWEPKVATV